MIRDWLHYYFYEKTTLVFTFIFNLYKKHIVILFLKKLYLTFGVYKDLIIYGCQINVATLFAGSSYWKLCSA